MFACFFDFSAWDLSDIEDIECLGVTEGILGKIEHTNIYDPHLAIIKDVEAVGQIYFQHTIYKIKSVIFLNIGPENQVLDLCACTKHSSSSSMTSCRKGSKMAAKLFDNAMLNKTVGAVKNVSNSIKSTTQQAASQVLCIYNCKFFYLLFFIHPDAAQKAGPVAKRGEASAQQANSFF